MAGFKFFAPFIWLILATQQTDANASPKPKILIIGAGAAGLAAGVKLLENGYKNLTILEAESRIGGRIHTIAFGDNVIDLGAQWCHGEAGNIVYEMVKDLQLLQHSTGAERNASFIRSDGEILKHKTTSRFMAMFDEIMTDEKAEMRNFNGSLRDFVAIKFAAQLKLPENQDIDAVLAKEALESFDRARCSADGCDTLSQVSARLLADYEECEGDYLLNWQTKGYKAFLEVLLKTQETEAEFGLLQRFIELAKTVEKIQWQRDDGKVLVKTQTGEQILADHVIVTVSLGVLKEQHGELFQPALTAQKTKAIEQIAIGTVNKMFLEFEKPFWPHYWSGLSILWCQEDLDELKANERLWLTDIFGFYTVASQPRLLSAWMNGPHRAIIENLSVEEAKNATMYLLSRFLAKSSLEIKQPIGFVRSKWASERNFRGTYSYHSMETAAAGITVADLAEPLFEKEAGKLAKPLVLFAGEATNALHYGTVHGAVETGFREAKRLKDFYEAQLKVPSDVN